MSYGMTNFTICYDIPVRIHTHGPYDTHSILHGNGVLRAYGAQALIWFVLR